ncbi:MAG TPA: MBL fold metallo-hydrolase [Gemmatimonadales bacterium]|nr:MBL fold metallo-hydrolase [Gemmatimonadales bacterium]
MPGNRLTVATLVLASLGCQEGTPASSAVIRTANPAARGLTQQDFPRLQRLADGVYSYEQLRSAGEERFTTVSLIVVTQSGVLVADGQGSVEETRRLVERVAQLTDQPITHVVIGSDHGDHTAGNSAFPRSAVFLAHPTSAAALRAAAMAPDRPADAPPVVIPTELVDGERVLQLGGTEVRILFLGRAHTGGDLVVYVPASRILFMSETFMNRVFPAMRSAYPSEWVAMLRRAQSMDVDLFVPGHGFVDPAPVLREELETYRRALEQVMAEARRLHAAGVSVEQAATQAHFGDLESWSLRASQGPRAIQQVYLELNGNLK